MFCSIKIQTKCHNKTTINIKILIDRMNQLTVIQHEQWISQNICFQNFRRDTNLSLSLSLYTHRYSYDLVFHIMLRKLNNVKNWLLWMTYTITFKKVRNLMKRKRVWNIMFFTAYFERKQMSICSLSHWIIQ